MLRWRCHAAKLGLAGSRFHASALAVSLAVDTHVFRVANRTGLAIGKTPIEVELRLLERVPQAFLPNAHHWLILHGRYVCQAKRPLCEVCAVVRWCDSAPPALKRAATPAPAGV